MDCSTITFPFAYNYHCNKINQPSGGIYIDLNIYYIFH